MIGLQDEGFAEISAPIVAGPKVRQPNIYLLEAQRPPHRVRCAGRGVDGLADCDQIVVDVTVVVHQPMHISRHDRLYEEGKMLALAGALEERLKVWHIKPPIG